MYQSCATVRNPGTVMAILLFPESPPSSMSVKRHILCLAVKGIGRLAPVETGVRGGIGDERFLFKFQVSTQHG
jgi:hypothetical protein